MMSAVSQGAAAIRSSDMAAKTNGAINTDFNHVSQFSLSSLKDSANKGSSNLGNTATAASNHRY